jgi:methyltransferase-like protein
METSSVILDKILLILAENYNKSCTLEELTMLLNPVLNASQDNTSAEKENQASILDILIYLNDEGYISLNPDTDESSITIKGFLKIYNKYFNIYAFSEN